MTPGGTAALAFARWLHRSLLRPLPDGGIGLCSGFCLMAASVAAQAFARWRHRSLLWPLPSPGLCPIAASVAALAFAVARLLPDGRIGRGSGLCRRQAFARWQHRSLLWLLPSPGLCPMAASVAGPTLPYKDIYFVRKSIAPLFFWITPIAPPSSLALSCRPFVSPSCLALLRHSYASPSCQPLLRHSFVSPSCHALVIGSLSSYITNPSSCKIAEMHRKMGFSRAFMRIMAVSRRNVLISCASDMFWAFERSFLAISCASDRFSVSGRRFLANSCALDRFSASERRFLANSCA